MKYNANDYFRKYLIYLSSANGLNIKDKDVLTYLKALSGCTLTEESFRFYPELNEICFDITIPNNKYLKIYIDTTDNSLNCSFDLQDAVYRIKLVNDKLCYSIYFNSNNKKDLNGIYFYESDEVGNSVCKFYDSKVIELLSNWKFRNNNLVFSNDSMLQNHGFSPDYEESHEYKGMLEYDAARAFNNILLTMNYYKTIEFMSSINKESKDVYNLELGIKM